MNINLSDIHTLVIKVGTTLLSGPNGFDGRILEGLVKEIIALKRERGMNDLIVSSGALGCGMASLGMKERPKVLPVKQAVAAVGQSRLMHVYEVLFETYGDGLKVAQLLLSGADLDNRTSYLNLRNTMQSLFELKNVVPILNENDTVATDELKFGDNDTLAAKVAGKIDADLLIIFSDIDGLYDKNPSIHADAQLIPFVESVTHDIEALAGDTVAVTSTGGMRTKLTAAKIANASGLPMIIANGRRENVLQGVLSGTAPCTLFGVPHAGISHRKRWIAYGRSPRGTLQVDEGAQRAIVRLGKSLLPAGVTVVTGEFEVGAAVRVIDANGHPIASGLSNYSSEELQRIKGLKTSEIIAALGHKDFDEVIHRDNMVVFDPADA